MNRQKSSYSPITDQAGVIFLLASVILALVMIIAIALTAKRAHDRQNFNRQSQDSVRQAISSP